MIFENNKYDYVHSSLDDFILNINKFGVHYVRTKEANPYEIYVDNCEGNSKKDYFIVGFSGAVKRKNSVPPYFSFKGIAKSLGVGLIAISDPSLRLDDDLKLSWYVGNAVNGNVALRLARLLDDIISSSAKKLILCGGSGGGFAALNIQTLMKQKDMTRSLVWNPQTDITLYSNKSLFNYLSSCYDFKKKSLIESRQFFKKNGINYRIVNTACNIDGLIMINGYDPNHIRKHVRRFITRNDFSSKLAVFIEDWGIGHVPPPKHIIKQVLKFFLNGLSGVDIAKKLNDYFCSNKKVLIFNDINYDYLSSVLEVRASTIIYNEHKIVTVKSNIYDYYFGYNLKLNVFNKEDLIYESKYLLGKDVAEFVFEILPKSKIQIKDIKIELLVEDLIGNAKKFKYNFSEINAFKRVRFKI